MEVFTASLRAISAKSSLAVQLSRSIQSLSYKLMKKTATQLRAFCTDLNAKNADSKHPIAHCILCQKLFRHTGIGSQTQPLLPDKAKGI